MSLSSVRNASARSQEGCGGYNMKNGSCLKISTTTLCRFERHQKECEGDERPKWAREAPVLNPGEDKEVKKGMAS